MYAEEDYVPIGFKTIFYRNEPIAWASIPENSNSRIILIGCKRGDIEMLLELPNEAGVEFNGRRTSMGATRKVMGHRIIDSYRTIEEYTNGTVEVLENWAR